MYSEWYHLNIPQNQVFSTKAIYLPCRDKEQGIGDKTGDQGQRRKAGEWMKRKNCHWIERKQIWPIEK